jgi:hypothetical protein
MKRLGLFVLIGYTASAGVAHAATYYVSKGGSDSNTCTQAQNVNTPKLTVAAGLACLAGGGDTLLIRAGTYNERITSVRSGTSWSSKVRIANYNGETVWLDPATGQGAVLLSAGQQYIEFDGINMRHHASNSVFSVHGTAHHIRYQNASVQNNNAPGGSTSVYSSTDGNEFINLDISGIGGPYGIYIDGGNGALIEGCEIHGVSMGGIHAYSDDRPSPTNVVIRNTRIYDITQSHFHGKPDTRVFGILISGNNNQVYNNLIYGIRFAGASGNTGIVIYTGSGNKVWNNTVANNTINGIKTDLGASNTEVRNNIAYGNTGSAFVNGGAGTIESNNLFGVDPLFMNPSGNDFKLKPDSRAVDAGAILSAVRTDLSGVARPQGRIHDIGAYEFSGQPAASGPPAPPTGVRIVSN